MLLKILRTNKFTFCMLPLQVYNIFGKTALALPTIPHIFTNSVQKMVILSWLVCIHVLIKAEIKQKVDLWERWVYGVSYNELDYFTLFSKFDSGYMIFMIPYLPAIRPYRRIGRTPDFDIFKKKKKKKEKKKSFAKVGIHVHVYKWRPLEKDKRVNKHEGNGNHFPNEAFLITICKLPLHL